MLVLNLPAFKNKKYSAYDRFHGNGPYGEILTKKEPIRMLGLAVPYNNVGLFSLGKGITVEVHFDTDIHSYHNLHHYYPR